MRPTLTRPQAGFTLIEMLVGLALLVVLALISWRGVDALMATETRSRERADAVARLQTGLAQWRTDLDAAVETQQVSVLGFDGRVLRLTRSDAGTHPGALRVVGWARQEGGQWMRWQSPPLFTSQALRQAWDDAATWARSRNPDGPNSANSALEVALFPLSDWQLYYFRNNSWSNPLSSAGEGESGQKADLDTLPDAVRLVLVLPPGPGLAGRLSQDWLRPTYSRANP